MNSFLDNDRLFHRLGTLAGDDFREPLSPQTSPASAQHGPMKANMATGSRLLHRRRLLRRIRTAMVQQPLHAEAGEDG